MISPARVSITIVFMALASLPATAQTANTIWFIQAGGGVGAHDNGPFSRRLQSYTPQQPTGERYVYNTETFANVGYSVGGALGVMLDGGMLLGLSGEMLSVPTIESITSPGAPRDQYVLGGWGGGLDIGYVIVNEDATIVYPFVNVGYHGYGLEYTNRQSDPIPFFEGKPVSPGQTAMYTGAAPRAALGIGLNSFVGAGGVGGFMIGARVSYGQMFARPEWEQDGEVVNNGGHTPAYNALTVSVAIGFGGGS